MKSRNIKWLVMDVDGTMTDGKIYMGASGETFKAFDVKDGYAIHEILPKYHEIKPTKDWIALFENVLPKDTWKPTTALEKLYPDGDALPRLMFHHVNGADKI